MRAKQRNHSSLHGGQGFDCFPDAGGGGGGGGGGGDLIKLSYRQALANFVDPEQTSHNTASDQVCNVCHSSSNFRHTERLFLK